MKTRKFLLLASWMIVLFPAKGQNSLDSLYILPDTVKSFTLDQLYATILEFHPIAKQTRLLRETALTEIRLARGAFDPKIESRFNNKEFNGKEYYSKWNASLSLPSWFPLDPKIGIEQNSGLYIDPENSVPVSDMNRQFFTGISLPLGKGLFTDDRRTTLKTAKLFIQMAEAEQVKLINKILLEAAKDYWQWYFSYYNYRLMQRNVVVASEIFERVKLNATHGEASIIDTVQAKIIWQQRQIEKQEALLEFINSGIRISNYLWDKDGHAIQLSPRIAPIQEKEKTAVLQLATLENLREQAKENHPELRKLNLKLNQLDLEKKLAIEYLKPRLDLNYNFLNQPLTPQGTWSAYNFSGNYKFGVDFSFPVLLRKERSKLAQTKIKIKGTEYELNQTEREIINQVNTMFNQLKNTNIILSQQKDMVVNYEKLLKAEILNLENGESDLFKINVQQEKLIQSQSKFLKLKSEYEKLMAQLYWAAGIQNLNFEAPENP
jgi:outer membrane protein TolC